MLFSMKIDKASSYNSLQIFSFWSIIIIIIMDGLWPEVVHDIWQLCLILCLFCIFQNLVNTAWSIVAQ